MDRQEPLPYWVKVQADVSIFWLYRTYCRFCHALAQISFSYYHVNPYYLDSVNTRQLLQNTVSDQEVVKQEGPVA